MSDEEIQTADEDSPPDSVHDSVTDLLKSTLREEGAPRVDVLAGVQKKLRERSGGKFYADRWSTSKQPPIATYLVTSLIMLAIVSVIYVVLAPLRGQAKAVNPDPQPVQVLPPP